MNGDGYRGLFQQPPVVVPTMEIVAPASGSEPPSATTRPVMTRWVGVGCCATTFVDARASVAAKTNTVLRKGPPALWDVARAAPFITEREGGKVGVGRTAGTAMG